MMKTGKGYRNNELVAEWVEFDDGIVAVHWTGKARDTSLLPSINNLKEWQDILFEIDDWPEVDEFAVEMKRVLTKNRDEKGKGAWHFGPDEEKNRAMLKHLKDKLIEEENEVLEPLDELTEDRRIKMSDEFETKTFEELKNESIDLAEICMMLWDHSRKYIEGERTE